MALTYKSSHDIGTIASVSAHHACSEKKRAITFVIALSLAYHQARFRLGGASVLLHTRHGTAAG